jgi:nucleotide-binding universal stress UspA family protein
MSDKRILVPVDFTKVSEVARDHAENVARHIGASVHFLHLVSKQGELKSAQSQMDGFIAAANELYGDAVSYSSEVREGSFLDEIADESKDINASLVIMGTHGMKGLQFIVGSNALRIVSNSDVPIVIVQERGIRAEGYDDIIVPLDLEKETKQKLHVVARLAKYFDSRVHLISPREDDEYLRNTLQRNLTFAETFFAGEGVTCTTKISEESSKDFDDAVVRYAASKFADLIAIMNLRENSLMGFLGGGYTQRIITNECMIPVLIMNPVMTRTNIDIFGM